MRVRFAPSPTGSLHVGGARTALYNYLIAKKNDGSFIVRIEDTDHERNVETASAAMLEDLAWLGLTWEEGPQCDGQILGEFGPYYQSQRTELYSKYAQQLLEQGKAYYCFMQDEEMLALKEAQVASGAVHHIQSPYRNMSLEDARQELEKRPATVRIKVPSEKTYSFTDEIRGEIHLPSSMLGDFVILRSDGNPVYNFCCVVDDHLMEITHVLRGEEHLPNTLKQLILFDLLGWGVPSFSHLSVIVGEDRKKLSKREASVSVGEFREQGYLPEALNNYVALLGWSHPEGLEMMSLHQMASSFDLSRVHASAAYFDRCKLKWMNAQYLREKTCQEIFLLCQARQCIDLSDLDETVFEKFWALFRSDCETIVDVEQRFLDLYYPSLPKEVPEFLLSDSLRLIWETWRNGLLACEDERLTQEIVKELIKHCQSVSAQKGKGLFVPLRWVVLGRAEGADLSQVAMLLSRSELLRRVNIYLELVGN